MQQVQQLRQNQGPPPSLQHQPMGLDARGVTAAAAPPAALDGPAAGASSSGAAACVAAVSGAGAKHRRGMSVDIGAWLLQVSWAVAGVHACNARAG
jgi:hypothetical protein